MLNISESFLTIYNQFHLIAWIVFSYSFFLLLLDPAALQPFIFKIQTSKCHPPIHVNKPKRSKRSKVKKIYFLFFICFMFYTAIFCVIYYTNNISRDLWWHASEAKFMQLWGPTVLVMDRIRETSCVYVLWIIH